MPVWFDAYSLLDIDERQELQVEGLKESVLHVLGVIESEGERLGGRTENVFLGGMSQGMATALWTLLCLNATVEGKGKGKKMLGGVCGVLWMVAVCETD